MSSSSLSFPLTVLGAVLLLHAAYSCLHYRNLISEYDWPVDAPAPTLPPIDVWWQVLAAFAILLTGQLLGAGPLRPVTTNTASSQSRQAPAYRTREFDLYTTRMGGLAATAK